MKEFTSIYMKTNLTKGKAMGKTPSCKKFRLMADEYIEGELTDAEMRDLEAHIAECEECRKELEELRALKEALRSAKEEVPEGLHSRIMQAVASESKAKPRRKTAFFRSAAISAACVMLCLSAALAITMIPLWRSNAGGEGLPNDPQYSLENTIIEECNTELENQSTPSAPTDENVEAEEPSVSEAMPAPGNTEIILETTSAPQTQAAAEMAPETATPETEKHYFKGETNKESGTPSKDSTNIQYSDASPEASRAPGGEEITLALLIVSGLLAIASFVAFLISLSSVRNTSQKKDTEE